MFVKQLEIKRVLCIQKMPFQFVIIQVLSSPPGAPTAVAIETPGNVTICVPEERCKTLPNGIYQSCQGCDVYAQCIHGRLYDGIKCHPGKVYDDTAKQCIYWSSTCGVEPNNGTCVSTCLGMPDGPYQSCRGCNVYVVCAGGLRYDDVLCPYIGQYWDDNLKGCTYQSTTCTAGLPPTQPPPKVGECISSCDGIPTGHYQSCRSCNEFIKCDHVSYKGVIPCWEGTEYDDNLKVCTHKSSTCSMS